MGERADTFLAHFNRIEKWMRERLNNPVNMGFSEMTRRLSRKEKGQIAQFEEDLLQMAQLRNAIVHERIADDFVIAEPNEWAVQRIETIEQALTKPEKVVPKFAKRVTAFEITTSLETLLTIIAKKQYSQFPIYEKGVFKGLVTVRGIGVWFAIEAPKAKFTLPTERCENCWHQIINAATINLFQLKQPFLKLNKCFGSSHA